MTTPPDPARTRLPSQNAPVTAKGHLTLRFAKRVYFLGVGRTDDQKDRLRWIRATMRRIASRFSPTQKPRSEQWVPPWNRAPPPPRFIATNARLSPGCDRCR